MSRVKIKERNGKRIIFTFYKGLDSNEIIEIFHRANTMTFKQPGELYALADFTDTTVDGQTLSYLKNDESKKAANHYKKSAVVGISGIQSIFLRIYNSVTGSEAQSFETVEEAEEWLVKD